MCDSILFKQACEEFNFCDYCAIEAFPSYSPTLFQGYIGRCDKTGIVVDFNYCKDKECLRKTTNKDT